jgi:hypothetical protein
MWLAVDLRRFVPQNWFLAATTHPPLRPGLGKPAMSVFWHFSDVLLVVGPLLRLNQKSH